MLQDKFPQKSDVSGIVVDTNLLLLLLIGIFDKHKIESTKLVNKYTIDDYHKIVYLIDYYSGTIIVTPNILTEICNLTDKINGESNYKFFQHLETFIKSQDEYIESSRETMAQNNKCFIKFGLSDASIYNLAKNNKLVITDDLGLYHFIISQGFLAINYNHLIHLNLKN